MRKVKCDGLKRSDIADLSNIYRLSGYLSKCGLDRESVTSPILLNPVPSSRITAIACVSVRHVRTGNRYFIPAGSRNPNKCIRPSAASSAEESIQGQDYFAIFNICTTGTSEEAIGCTYRTAYVSPHRILTAIIVRRASRMVEKRHVLQPPVEPSNVAFEVETFAYAVSVQSCEGQTTTAFCWSIPLVCFGNRPD